MDRMLAGLALSRRHLLVFAASIALTAAVSLALASPASAQLTFGSFATQGDANAGWIEEPNAPPGSSEQESIGLFVNGTAADDFSDAARAIFTGVTGVPPATPPSFDFKVFTVGGSGGAGPPPSPGCARGGGGGPPPPPPAGAPPAR